MEIKNWKMTYEGHKDLPCQVPCSMYSVLLEHGIIEDPYAGLNDQRYTALSDKDCQFAGTFFADDAMLGREFVEITFLGLDTICEIICNGAVLDRVNNMHCAYTYDLKPYLVAGENALLLKFSSPTRFFRERNKRHYLWSGDDCIPGASHLRKALCMSGWDWGPQLPDMGIFRPVEIRAYDQDKIEDVQVLQFHEEDSVRLEINVTTKHYAGLELYAEIDGQKILLENGQGTVMIRNPKLWWARGYGEQYLYDLQVTMVSGDQTVDSKTERIGLRTVTVSTEKDKVGREFAFVLNGVKIFAMGANYIPQDSILSRISRERTAKLLEDCCDANFNCIRVWGGGYYPEDDFYDLCDEMGLLVWQDFMVACANVWLTEDFTRNFIREAIYNLKRFRNHASFAMLCGNNEMEEAIETWDKDSYNDLVRMDYLHLYEHILPELTERYAPQTFYWPSSPSSGGGFDEPTNNCNGDVHYWKVWHGNAPFTDYRNYQFRFCSEYGFESFPSMKTIRTYCPEEERNPFSRVMEDHQKCKSGNGKIVNYISDNYLYPVSMEQLVYTSQLLQAEAIQYGVEYFRRIRNICKGSLYWQVNDCWPVASWSSIDYYGRRKALHYAAKKFYAPIAVGLFLEEDGLTVNVSNETMEAFRGSVRVRFCKNDFTLVEEHTAKISVKKLTSSDVLSVDVPEMDRYGSYAVVSLYGPDGQWITDRTQMFVKPKHYSFANPNIRAAITDVPGGVEIALKADCFARAVEVDFAELDCPLPDNFFDLTDGETRVLRVETHYTARELEDNLILRSVWDIGYNR